MSNARSTRLAARGVAPAALLAALLVLVPVPLLAADEGNTCAADDAASKEDAVLDTIRPTRPGPWRADAKLQPPRLRIPGTRERHAERPAGDRSDHGRALGPRIPSGNGGCPGGVRSLEGGAGGQTRNRPVHRRPEPADEQLRLEPAERGAGLRRPRRTIEHFVREEKYEIFSVDLREIEPSEEVTVRKDDKPESDTGIDHHSGLTWEEYNWVKEQAINAPATPDAQEAAGLSALALTPAGVAFDAIADNDGFVPPDPIMAVGPGHVIAIVNSQYRVWDKTGTPLIATLTINTFFSGVPNCSNVFDVFVDYDEASKPVRAGRDDAGVDLRHRTRICASPPPPPTTRPGRGTGPRSGPTPSCPRCGSITRTWGSGLDAIYIGGNMFVDNGTSMPCGCTPSTRPRCTTETPSPSPRPPSARRSSPHNRSSSTATRRAAGRPPAHRTTSSPTTAAATAGSGGGAIRFPSAPVTYGTLVVPFNGVPPSAKELGATSTGRNDTGNGRWLDAEYPRRQAVGHAQRGL